MTLKSNTHFVLPALKCRKFFPFLNLLIFLAIISLLSCGVRSGGLPSDTGGNVNKNDGGTIDPNVNDGGLPADNDSPSIDDSTSTGGQKEKEIQCNFSFPSSIQGCQVIDGDQSLLLAGNVLAPDAVYRGGQVLVNQSGKITCVGCDCSTQTVSATKILCPNGMIAPAWINAHDHITFTLMHPADHGMERYEHRHDWRKAKRGHTKISASSDRSNNAIIWGEIRNIISGTVSIAGSGGAKGLLRNLDRDNEGLGVASLKYTTFPLGDSSGKLLSNSCDYGKIDSRDAMDKYSAYIPHVAEGIDPEAHNEFTCVSSTQKGGHDLIMPTSAFIHCVGCDPADIGIMAAGQTSLIWSPRSNIDLYGHTAQTPIFNRMGVNISLGTDWTASGSMNMLRELDCAVFLNENYYNRYFSDKQLFDMATANSARACGVALKTGALKKDLWADISIYDCRGDCGYGEAIRTKLKDVALVMRAGKTLYGEASIIEALLGRDGQACDKIDLCGSAKRLCLKSDYPIDLPTLRSNLTAKSPYPLFFCDTPEREPSCVPFRQGEFSGQSTSDDKDADGIPNQQDSCPSMFNPKRPMSDNLQPDHDQDGVGDICDPCPLQANTSQCSSINLSDRDSDGLDNDQDNCPQVKNPDQADKDGDKIGDVCDLCPEQPNASGGACAFSIAAIRDPKHPKHPAEGSKVAVKDVVVTAVKAVEGKNSNGFWVQDKTGGPYSGIFVYTGSKLAKDLGFGMVVDLEGIYKEYYDLAEITDVTYTVKQGLQTPIPIIVKPDEVGTGGSKAEAYESLFVKVENVKVTQQNPDEPNNYGDFMVDEKLRISNLIIPDYKQPQTETVFKSITGILYYAYSNSKLCPRQISDLDLVQ